MQSARSSRQQPSSAAAARTTEEIPPNLNFPEIRGCFMRTPRGRLSTPYMAPPSPPSPPFIYESSLHPFTLPSSRRQRPCRPLLLRVVVSGVSAEVRRRTLLVRSAPLYGASGICPVLPGACRCRAPAPAHMVARDGLARLSPCVSLACSSNTFPSSISLSPSFFFFCSLPSSLALLFRVRRSDVLLSRAPFSLAACAWVLPGTHLLCLCARRDPESKLRSLRPGPTWLTSATKNTPERR